MIDFGNKFPKYMNGLLYAIRAVELVLELPSFTKGNRAVKHNNVRFMFLADALSSQVHCVTWCAFCHLLPT